ncbi:MAG: hypothetical protein U9R27_08745 [Campylobacterota bacterium]|nr:hypothetical protein [Campylobacterota bacterium]
MKKLILISAIAATTLFAEGLADVAQKAAVDHTTKEATKIVNDQIAKVTGTTKEKAEATDTKTEEKAEATKTEEKDTNSSEKAKEPASLKDKAIDAAAGQVADKTGASKDVAKTAIKSVVK